MNGTHRSRGIGQASAVFGRLVPGTGGRIGPGGPADAGKADPEVAENHVIRRVPVPRQRQRAARRVRALSRIPARERNHRVRVRRYPLAQGDGRLIRRRRAYRELGRQRGARVADIVHQGARDNPARHRVPRRHDALHRGVQDIHPHRFAQDVIPRVQVPGLDRRAADHRLPVRRGQPVRETHQSRRPRAQRADGLRITVAAPYRQPHAERRRARSVVPDLRLRRHRDPRVNNPRRGRNRDYARIEDLDLHDPRRAVVHLEDVRGKLRRAGDGLRAAFPGRICRERHVPARARQMSAHRCQPVVEIPDAHPHRIGLRRGAVSYRPNRPASPRRWTRSCPTGP